MDKLKYIKQRKLRKHNKAKKQLATFIRGILLAILLVLGMYFVTVGFLLI